MSPQQEWTPKHGDSSGTASTTSLNPVAPLSSPHTGIYISVWSVNERVLCVGMSGCVCMCFVCMCTWERKTDRWRERQTERERSVGVGVYVHVLCVCMCCVCLWERQTDRQMERERENCVFVSKLESWEVQREIDTACLIVWHLAGWMT